MDSSPTRLEGLEIAQLISERRLCPYPRPHYRPHAVENTDMIEKLRAMPKEEQQAWLAERRKAHAILQVNLQA